MFVRELVALLQQQDPDAKVYSPGIEDGVLVVFDIEGVTPATSEILGNAVIIDREE